ncbi:hypothetical protein Scep_010959 [Stephania cephalantha]|uniref:EF-hand domain-containing protein n=1 Tax=Stephania cephalantha TaxID=152367 RepID=A0AAP0PDS9_9MAGN
MPTLLFKISQIYNLFTSFLHYFFPKKLMATPLFMTPPLHAKQQQQQQQQQQQEEQKVHCMDYSSELPSELKRVFDTFDRDGDGRITKGELRESLGKLGISVDEEGLEEMVAKIDVNGDGCVDMEEFGVLYEAIVMRGGEGEDEDEDEEMREAFNVFDQNGDGFISGEELREVLGCLGLKHGRSVEDCRKMITMVDGDGDGMVNFEEFKEMMRGGITSSGCGRTTVIHI